MQTTTFFTNLNPIIMKKYLLICAGALTTIAACTEDKKYPNSDPIGKAIVQLDSKNPTSVASLPAGGIVKLKVFRITHMEDAISINITKEWNADTTTDKYKDKINVAISGDGTTFGESATLNFAAGATEGTFSVKATSSQSLLSGQSAKLKITITSANAHPQSSNNMATITITGASAFASAPSYSVVYGRMNSLEKNNGTFSSARPDTLWFGLTKDYYATAPTITDYKVEVQTGASAAFTDVTASYTIIDSITKGKLGVEVATSVRDAWNADDTISMRVILPQPTGQAGQDDTITTTFVVKPDKLTSKTTFDFTPAKPHFALFGKKDIIAALIPETAKTDVVFSMIEATNGDLTLKTTASDSCKVVVASATEQDFDAALRTSGAEQGGAQYASYSTFPSPNVITLPATGSLTASDYHYYAVKIASYKMVEKVKKPAEYYGYIRLHYTWAKTEFTFIYDEGRDYTKE
jgi:hypothetical protein